MMPTMLFVKKKNEIFCQAKNKKNKYKKRFLILWLYAILKS